MCRTTSLIVEPATPRGTGALEFGVPATRPVVVAADPTVAGEVAPPSKLRKEQMKLAKKLHQIMRLEDFRAQGGRVDKKQLEKLARRTEVEEQLAVVEQALQEEEEEELQQQQALLATHESEAVPELVPTAPVPPVMTPMSAPTAALTTVGPVLPQPQMMPAVAPHAAPAQSSMTAPAGVLQCQHLGFLATGAPQPSAMISPRPQPAAPMPAPEQPLQWSQPCAPPPVAVPSGMPITVFLVPVQVTGAPTEAAPAAWGPMDAVPGTVWRPADMAQGTWPSHDCGSIAWSAPAVMPTPSTTPTGDALAVPPTFACEDSLQLNGRNCVADTFSQSLKGSMLRMSLDAAGCREVQAALPGLDQRAAAELLVELHGRVPALIKSPYGNYVIQKVIEVMPPAQVSFVVAELHGWAANAAKHKFGCRILCRLLEHSTGATMGLRAIMDELLQQADELIRHPYAHHVMEALLEHGRPEQRRRVTEALCWDVSCNASDRHGCYVIEAAAAHCDGEEQEMLVQAHLRLGLAKLLDLAQSRYGSLSVKALLKCQGAAASPGIAAPLRGEARLLSQTKYGRRLLQELSTDKGCHAALAA